MSPRNPQTEGQSRHLHTPETESRLTSHSCPPPRLLLPLEAPPVFRQTDTRTPQKPSKNQQPAPPRARSARSLWFSTPDARWRSLRPRRRRSAFRASSGYEGGRRGRDGPLQRPAVEEGTGPHGVEGVVLQRVRAQPGQGRGHGHRRLRW